MRDVRNCPRIQGATSPSLVRSLIVRSTLSGTATRGLTQHRQVPFGHYGEPDMHISIRAAHAAALGTLLLGGCTVNNRPPDQIVVRQAPATTTMIVTPPASSEPGTVYVQPR